MSEAIWGIKEREWIWHGKCHIQVEFDVLDAKVHEFDVKSPKTASYYCLLMCWIIFFFFLNAEFKSAFGLCWHWDPNLMLMTKHTKNCNEVQHNDNAKINFLIWYDLSLNIPICYFLGIQII